MHHGELGNSLSNLIHFYMSLTLDKKVKNISILLASLAFVTSLSSSAGENNPKQAKAEANLTKTKAANFAALAEIESEWKRREDQIGYGTGDRYQNNRAAARAAIEAAQKACKPATNDATDRWPRPECTKGIAKAKAELNKQYPLKK